MLSKTYQSNQLISILDSLIKDKTTGVLSIKTNVSFWQKQRSYILILRDGELIYGGTHVPNNRELCMWLGEILKPNLIKAALSVATEKIAHPNSIVELVELLIKMRVFTWQEVEALITTKVVLILEKILRYPGETQWDKADKLSNFDLSYGEDRHGLDWSHIRQELNQRRQKWLSFATKIPSMDAVPIVTPQQYQRISSPQVKEHFKNSVDGINTLVDIAEKMGKDSLSIAKSYFNWANQGWVSFKAIPQTTSATAEKTMASNAVAADGLKLPTVLSVDDSQIVQTTIKRALSEEYNVLLANGATKALEILRTRQVDLMLLDLTMPDIDGLEFCRIVRKISEFRELPIVMVTARDGLVNKMKGHIAGTNKYLTKPFSPEQLRETVRQSIAR